jgi:hypothetical protein
MDCRRGGESDVKNMEIPQKTFGRNKKSGLKAENYLIENFFPSQGLSFEKIPECEQKTPDGWVLHKEERIALVEIKFIQQSADEDGCRIITIDKTIQRAISSAKKQLKSIRTELPKILYLIMDDHFADFNSFIDAAFGPNIEEHIALDNGESIKIYSGRRGFHPAQKKHQDNKILGNWVSAIFCCYLNRFEDKKQELIILKLKDEEIPKVLLENKKSEIWEYDKKYIIRKK